MLLTVRVRIIASSFTNCEVNSTFVIVKLYIILKLQSSFFSKENLIRPNYIFPRYILILFINCILLSKEEIVFIPNITAQNAKSASQFLKKQFHLLQDKSLPTLSIFIAMWISNDTSNAGCVYKHLNWKF